MGEFDRQESGEVMTRRDHLNEIFSNVDENEKALIGPLIDEVVSLEEQMMELRKLPFIKVHPKNPEIQKTTPAAKLYKECSQSYMNAMRILINVLRKVETSAQDELMKRLEEFM